METLADDLHHLSGFPPNTVNAYLMGGVLVDAKTKFDGKSILRQLAGREVSAHALTHAHGDHCGSCKFICETLGIPLWCGEADAPAVEDPRLMIARMPRSPARPLIGSLLAPPACAVDRRLREGDEVGGFTVLETPGHTEGHLAYWRAADRTLILGDVLTNMNLFTLRPGLHEPPGFFTADPAKNRASARRLGLLEPSLICFGHGPPLRDTGRFVEFCARLRA